MNEDDAFLKRLLATFKVEAAEHIEKISSGLLELEKTPAAGRRSEVTEIVFREAHSLKGAARSVNNAAVETVCRSMENVFSVLKKQDMELASDFFDLLHRALDLLRDVLGVLDTEGKAPDKSLLKGVVSDLDNAAKGLESRTPGSRTEPVRAPAAPVGPAAAPERHMPVTPESVRVEKVKLDSVLLQAEGLLQAKQSVAERASDLRETLAGFEFMEKRWTSARNDTRAIGRLLKRRLTSGDAPGMRASVTRLLEFLESGRDSLREQHGRLASVARRMENDYRSVGVMVDALLEGTKRISMTPFWTLFDVLPVMVRNLLSEQGKEAELIVSGGDVEVDRRILEEMKDPLIHLVRNCVDHGLEKPGERVTGGKPPRGKISVSVSHRDSGKVELVVADDGRGIDIGRVRTSAVRLGILSPNDAEKLDKEDLLPLVFRTGVSTSPLITDISGRGLGLAIVQEKAERLGGMVSAESSPESGALFRMLLPVTLATVRGLLVRLEEQFFVIPAADVKRTIRVSPRDITSVEGRETVSVDGDTVPLVPLARLLELPLRARDPVRTDFLYAAVLESEDKVIAFMVDEVVGEQQFLVKALGRQLKRVRNVSGATVLGAGRVAPVLNVPDLMKSAVKGAEAIPSVVKAARQPEGTRSLLVVEDSVTARTLLKSILEAAGYDVKCAIDGLDAYALLKAETFDLVVSDVDMPRMSGFELTTKIRSDKKLAELPVVLVTALDSRADRERGIDVGANAYIVKSSFDQSNLLEVIKRLM